MRNCSTFLLVVYLFLSVAFQLAAQPNSEMDWLQNRIENSIEKSTLAYKLLNDVDLEKLDSIGLIEFEKLKIDNWKRVKRIKLVGANLEKGIDTIENNDVYDDFYNAYSATSRATNFGYYWEDIEVFLTEYELISSQTLDSIGLAEISSDCKKEANLIYNQCICSVREITTNSPIYWTDEIAELEKLKCDLSRCDLINICQILRRLKRAFKNESYFDGLLAPCSSSH